MSDAPHISPAPPADREAFEQSLLALIQKRAAESKKWPAAASITADTPLFETGLIDSMGILEIIAFVERAAGSQIPTRMVVMKYFRNVRSIAETFSKEPPGEPHG